MNVRRSNDHTITGTSSKFNVMSLDEIIVYFDGGEASSEYIRDYDVQLASGKWLSLSHAFKVKLVIPDNYHVDFRECANASEYNRGWYD